MFFGTKYLEPALGVGLLT